MFPVNIFERITLVVFFHSLNFRYSYKQILILSKINLLVLPISFSAGFISRVAGWLIKMTCIINFHSVKYTSSFCVLYTFLLILPYFVLTMFIYKHLLQGLAWLWHFLVNLHIYGSPFIFIWLNPSALWQLRGMVVW